MGKVMWKKALCFISLSYLACGSGSEPQEVSKEPQFKLGDLVVEMRAQAILPAQSGTFLTSIRRFSKNDLAAQDFQNQQCKKETVAGCVLTTCSLENVKLEKDESWKVWGWERSRLNLKSKKTNATLSSVTAAEYEGNGLVYWLGGLFGSEAAPVWTSEDSTVSVNVSGMQAPLADFQYDLPVPAFIQLEQIGETFFRTGIDDYETLELNPSQPWPLRWNYKGNAQGNVEVYLISLNAKQSQLATCRFSVSQGKSATLPAAVASLFADKKSVNLSVQVKTSALKTRNDMFVRWGATASPTFEGKPYGNFEVKWPGSDKTAQ